VRADVRAFGRFAAGFPNHLRQMRRYEGVTSSEGTVGTFNFRNAASLHVRSEGESMQQRHEYCLVIFIFGFLSPFISDNVPNVAHVFSQ